MAFKDWSTTAGDNDDADGSINWAEGQAPSTVNGSARAMMAVIKGAFSHVISANDYGALGDGATDDSDAIQDAIDAAQTGGGGFVYFAPGNYKANVTLKEGVFLIGNPGGIMGDLASFNTYPQVRFTANATGVVIDTPATAIGPCGVVGINIQGLGAGTACKGIHFRNVNGGLVKGVNLNAISDEGLLVASDCGGCVFEDIFAVNCVLDRTQAAQIGAVDIDGTDHRCSKIEATISGGTEGTVQSASLYHCAIVIRMDNGFCKDFIGEISDVGIYVSGTLNRFTDCRADLNYGHGWQIVGDSNQLSNCFSLNNSQDTTNTYDNFIVSSVGDTNLFTNCRAASTEVKVARYGFNDAVQSDTTKNRYVNCYSTGAGTDNWNISATSGSAVFFPSGTAVTLTANSATPSVAQHCNFITNNSSTTTITNFTGGVQGQEISILCNDNNTTVQHNGSTITLPNAGNKKLRRLITYKFIKSGAVWREAADMPLGTTADVGNAAKTLQFRVDEETQIWDTPLTFDRAVTLSGTGAFAGAKFHIVRTANSTGAFNLNVGSGPLKALGIGEWCEVTYNGTAWVLTKYGSL